MNNVQVHIDKSVLIDIAYLLKEAAEMIDHLDLRLFNLTGCCGFKNNDKFREAANSLQMMVDLTQSEVIIKGET